VPPSPALSPMLVLSASFMKLCGVEVDSPPGASNLTVNTQVRYTINTLQVDKKFRLLSNSFQGSQPNFSTNFLYAVGSYSKTSSNKPSLSDSCKIISVPPDDLMKSICALK